MRVYLVRPDLFRTDLLVELAIWCAEHRLMPIDPVLTTVPTDRYSLGRAARALNIPMAELAQRVRGLRPRREPALVISFDTRSVL